MALRIAVRARFQALSDQSGKPGNHRSIFGSGLYAIGHSLIIAPEIKNPRLPLHQKE